jgi:hypothetical protein
MEEQAVQTGREEVYVMRERVKVVKEVRDDFLIEDIDSGQQFLIDKEVFRRKYIQESELVPVHQEVWDRMENQALQLYQMKRANTDMRNQLKSARQELDKLRGKRKEKQHYRNGQKRGRTRNG